MLCWPFGRTWFRNSNPGTVVFWVGGDLDHRVSTDPHQQIVGLALVLAT